MKLNLRVRGFYIKKYTRRIASYIAARIISGKSANTIYDYDKGRYFNMSDDINFENVYIYDFDQRCYVTESRNNQSYSLYHYDNKKYIK